MNDSTHPQQTKNENKRHPKMKYDKQIEAKERKEICYYNLV